MNAEKAVAPQEEIIARVAALNDCIAITEGGAALQFSGIVNE